MTYWAVKHLIESTPTPPHSEGDKVQDWLMRAALRLFLWENRRDHLNTQDLSEVTEAELGDKSFYITAKRLIPAAYDEELVTYLLRYKDTWPIRVEAPAETDMDLIKIVALAELHFVKRWRMFNRRKFVEERAMATFEKRKRKNQWADEPSSGETEDYFEEV